ncbi:GNAT family N-acetyltransferase [Arthrobacter tumbae]|uniref:GNAT family N-acetyltransferase n=1 Tax=Arthrobacter tumbae TaxID=163874 RepID=UPI001EF906FB|nr:GNAT family protein [Arthrobacter tumbae]MBM7781837.1 RimJ/RimL family protein N-acetyltransferase [Arthrobacter tumbae]
MSQFANVEEATAYGAGILEGDRVRFRRLHESDLEKLDQWWSAPEWAVLQQSTIRPRPEGSAAELYREWSANATSASVGFSIEIQETKDFIGHVALYGATIPERAATLGVILDPVKTGQGYGTDAVKTAIRYGFLQMGLNRIELQAWAFNTRAIRAYSKAGFVEEGRRREAVFYDGAFHDQIIMSILQREWDHL